MYFQHRYSPVLTIQESSSGTSSKKPFPCTLVIFTDGSSLSFLRSLKMNTSMLFRLKKSFTPVSAVFKDFHFFSLKEAIVPQIISLRKDPTNVNLNILVKANPANFHKAFDIMEKEWLAIIPDRPFEYELLDDEISAIYTEERRIGNLSLIFSILAVLLSLEGLTVFIIYMTRQKSKEIAVRKVLGATTLQIIMLLNKIRLLSSSLPPLLAVVLPVIF